jgi:predicted phosphate transport protein (TIGR00153 family)
MRISLTPRTAEFFTLFARAGENALEVARLVERRFREHPNSDVTQEQVKRVETEGDGITRELITLLNTQYITPFDRDDIFLLATEIDDVVDYLEEASDLLGLYGLEMPSPHANEQCAVIVRACEQLSIACDNLKGMRGVQEALVEVKRHEDDGDRIRRDALASLFSGNGADPLVVIRWKDIYEALERALDACETAANVLGNIVVKNA